MGQQKWFSFSTLPRGLLAADRSSSRPKMAAQLRAAIYFGARVLSPHCPLRARFVEDFSGNWASVARYYVDFWHSILGSCVARSRHSLAAIGGASARAGRSFSASQFRARHQNSAPSLAAEGRRFVSGLGGRSGRRRLRAGPVKRGQLDLGPLKTRPAAPSLAVSPRSPPFEGHGSARRSCPWKRASGLLEHDRLDMRSRPYLSRGRAQIARCAAAAAAASSACAADDG